MALVFPLVPPNTLGNETDQTRFTLRKVEPMEMTQSPWSGVQQVQASMGQWWEADAALAPLKRDQAAEWEAFFMALGGSFGTFLMGDPEFVTPVGVGGGNPKVSAVVEKRATALDVYNAPASTIGWLKAGDYIQLGTGANSRIHRLLEDVDTDSNGGASLSFWPFTRSDIAQDSEVLVTGTVGVWRIKPGTMSFDRGPMFTTINFSCVEALSGS